MAKPRVHAKKSAKLFGGKPEDYQEIHDFMDSPKAADARVSHRVVFHSAFGCFIVEKIFGKYLVNSDGREVSIRDLAEQHILDDLGFIPALSEYLDEMTVRPWMKGQRTMLNHPKIKELLKKDPD